MKKALDALTDQDLQHIALYYALQSENLTRAQTPNGAGAPVTKEALAPCVKCHGEDGIGDSPITPSLAGQDLAYMVNALRAYKDGTRDDPFPHRVGNPRWPPKCAQTSKYPY